MASSKGIERIRGRRVLALAFGTATATTACLVALGGALPVQAQAAPQHVYVEGQDLAAGGTVAAGGGTATYDPVSSTLTLDNATITTPRSGYFVWFSNAGASDKVKVVLKGANRITGGNSDSYAIYSECSLSIGGSGSLAVDSCGYGVYANGGIGTNPTLDVTGGTIDVSAASGGLRSKGKLTVSGGKVTVNLQNPNGYALYSTGSTVSNKASAISVKGGLLGEGASFKKSGSTYKVSSTGYYAQLVSYGGGTKATLDSTSYGSGSYRIRSIGANAFNTAKGKKVKGITMGSLVNSIGANAFKNTKALTSLNIKSWYYNLLGSSGVSLAKTAFAGCGKSGGAKLTVHTGRPSGKYYTTNPQVKKALVKKGLSKKAKVAK